MSSLTTTVSARWFRGTKHYLNVDNDFGKGGLVFTVRVLFSSEFVLCYHDNT